MDIYQAVKEFRNDLPLELRGLRFDDLHELIDPNSEMFDTLSKHLPGFPNNTEEDPEAVYLTIEKAASIYDFMVSVDLTGWTIFHKYWGRGEVVKTDLMRRYHTVLFDAERIDHQKNGHHQPPIEWPYYLDCLKENIFPTEDFPTDERETAIIASMKIKIDYTPDLIGRIQRLARKHMVELRKPGQNYVMVNQWTKTKIVFDDRYKFHRSMEVKNPNIDGMLFLVDDTLTNNFIKLVKRSNNESY